ncbi:MAG TPA: M81 family metallopeptidase [bacterium]|nr:M81 family metallopeptidase [bacterium]
MNILIASIKTETNTFASAPTTLNDFRRGVASFSTSGENQKDFPRGKDILNHFRSTRTITGGYINSAEKNGLSLEYLIYCQATPGGTVKQDAYDFLKGELLQRMDEAEGYDGIHLDLHGAMVSEKTEDVEGDIIASVRQKAGDRIPIVVTLDLHANITALMAREANVIIGYDQYPHTDMYERGMEAADVMASILKGKVVPTLAYRQIPLITLPPKQCTLTEPMASLLAKAHDIERKDKVINVTLSMGFPFSDIRDTGVSVLVTTNNDRSLAENLVSEMAHAIWEKRDEFSVRLTPISEAIDYAGKKAKGLVVLADGSDNPGGGGPCDGTVILQEFIDNKVENAVVAVIADPQSVKQAIEAGVGNTVTLKLGGKTDNLHGKPVQITAYVKLLSDGRFVPEGLMGAGAIGNMGRTAVLVKEGVEIVVTEHRLQPYDTALLRSVGIEPTRRRLIALKSAVHFRGTYQKIAERIFDADTPGVHRPDFSRFQYKNLRKPIYPLQQHGEEGPFRW